MPRKQVKRPMGEVEVREFHEVEWGATWEQLAMAAERIKDDWAWFSRNMVSLRRRYMNKWVAVRSRRIVLADADHDRLLKRLKGLPEGRACAEVFFVAPKSVDHIF